VFEAESSINILSIYCVDLEPEIINWNKLVKPYSISLAPPPPPPTHKLTETGFPLLCLSSLSLCAQHTST
jgi:hypothetical protein